MREITRFDFVFSYWIFAWYLIYELKYIKYNPKFALTIGLIQNIIGLIFMFFYKNSLVVIFLFCFINFFIKVIPLWRLHKTKYNWSQVFYTILFYIIYSFWLLLNGTNPYQVITKSYEQIKKNEPIGPISSYLNQLMK
jgi:hypothetical protein